MKQEFAFENIGETRNYFFEKVGHYELMSRKHKNKPKLYRSRLY